MKFVIAARSLKVYNFEIENYVEMVQEATRVVSRGSGGRFLLSEFTG